VLEAANLGVDLGRRRVVDAVSFSFDAASFVGLIGPNGAGKSTLLRTLAGLLPYAGSLTLDGREISQWKPTERARRIAYVEQAPALAFALTVRDVVSLGRAPHSGWLSALDSDDARIVREAIDTADLGDLADRPATALSGGERQRVAIARGLAQDTSILLLDEPAAHLDIRHRITIMRHASRLVAAGRTVVAAFHDIGLAASLSDRLLVLDRGKLAADGSPVDTVTPALLRSVFGVGAEVSREGSSVVVRYLEEGLGIDDR
jgi:iron complex transport system ATP-binding protein